MRKKQTDKVCWICVCSVTSTLFNWHLYNKVYHHFYKQIPASPITLSHGAEVGAHAMSVCIWSPCAWPVFDWIRAVGHCPCRCSVTAGMSWSSPTWQRANWVCRSAVTVLSSTSAPVHLFTESTVKDGTRGWCTWQQQSTVLHVKIRNRNLRGWNKKDFYLCQNASWDILKVQIKLLLWFWTSCRQLIEIVRLLHLLILHNLLLM